MTDQLFKDEESVTTQATPEQQSTPEVNPNDLFTDQLAAIKNSEGVPKYDTVEKAIEALQHSQKYIPELKDKVSSQEQLINELKAKLEATESVQEIISKQTTPNTEEPTSAPAISEADIEALLERKLEQRNAELTASSNAEKVSQTLTSKYGDNAQAEIAQKARQLGLAPSELGELAKKNPTMVLALFGEKLTGTTNPTSTSIRIPGHAPEIKPVSRPAKSVLSGATTKDQAEHMAEIRAEVYRKHGITA